MNGKKEFEIAYDELSAALSECTNVCEGCFELCLKEGHKETALLCRDCADICAVTLKFLNRHSVIAPSLLQLCTELCKKCSEACGKMKAEHCQICAKVCMKCFHECNKTEET